MSEQTLSMFTDSEGPLLTQVRSAAVPNSGLRDNHNRGRVVDFLREKIAEGSELSIVSAYFTIYAYASLGEELVGHLQ